MASQGVFNTQTFYHTYRSQLSPQCYSFINICEQDIPIARFASLDGTQEHTLVKTLQMAIKSRAIKVHLSAKSDVTEGEFAQMLYDQVLIAAYHAAIKLHSPRHNSLLQSVLDNPGHYELAPHIGQAVREFAQQCIEKHGALLALPSHRSTAR